MAGQLRPNQFDITICTNEFRFSAIMIGCTVAACAASNALATARACPAAPDACAAAALSHSVYGAAAAIIAADAAPCHACPASPDVTEPNDEAAPPSSEANPSQAAAASNIGAEPAPANISKELISGGNTIKLITVTS